MDYTSVVGVALILGAVCFALFKCGQCMRRGVELGKHIEGGRTWAIVTKQSVDEAKCRQLNRKVKVLIAGPLLALCLFFIAIASQLGLFALLISLLSLVIVGFGYSRYKGKVKMRKAIASLMV